MEWNVYYYNINRNKIELFNIFDHWSFCEYTKKAMKKLKTKEEFAEQLKRELQFFYWSKAEWELIVEITEDNRVYLIPWCGCRNPEEVKIEINPVVTEDGFNWLEFARLHTKRQRYKNKAKIDVYDQVEYMWNDFLELVWDSKKRKKKKEDMI